jgi:hypothetical protein
MLYYFFNSASLEDADIPVFVYFAFLGTLVLISLFGVNSFAHPILRLYSFPEAEVVYVVLSFTAKSFLATDVFGGLRASSND